MVEQVPVVLFLSLREASATKQSQVYEIATPSARNDKRGGNNQKETMCH